MKKIILSSFLVIALLSMVLVSVTPEVALAKMQYAFYEEENCASGVGVIEYYMENGLPVINNTWCFPCIGCWL
jgi:hypothetical protein